MHDGIVIVEILSYTFSFVNALDLYYGKAKSSVSERLRILKHRLGICSENVWGAFCQYIANIRVYDKFSPVIYCAIGLKWNVGLIKSLLKTMQSVDMRVTGFQKSKPGWCQILLVMNSPSNRESTTIGRNLLSWICIHVYLPINYANCCPFTLVNFWKLCVDPY